MAGLVVVAGMVMIDRHRQKREAKAQKIIYDDRRYAELQRETEERLSRSPTSSTASEVSHRRIFSDASTVDSLFAEKEAARVIADDDHKRRKWWKPKPRSDRRRSMAWLPS